MPSLRRVFAIFTALVLVGWIVTAYAQDGKATRTIPTFTTVPGVSPATTGVVTEVELADGKVMTGEFSAMSIRLRTDYGTSDIEVASVKTLDISTSKSEMTANVKLTNKSQMYGPLLTESLPLIIDGKRVEIPAQDAVRVVFKHKPDTSLLGALIGLLTLTLMEIVLGVDNVIFLAIVAGKLPKHQQKKARRIGLGAALGTRLLLLLLLSWLIGLTRPIFYLPELPFLSTLEARGISWRDLILLLGGMFLIGKSTLELHAKVEKEGSGSHAPTKHASFASVIVQIAIIDIVFSLDSVITAIGMVDELWVMVTAVIISVGIMLVAAEPIATFVEKRPTLKVLALSFLILIGVLLVAEGLGQHMNKGYIYFAMAFSVCIEMINMQLRTSST